MHVESRIVSLLNGRTAVGSRLDLAGSFLERAKGIERDRKGRRGRNRIHPLGGGGGGGKREGKGSSMGARGVVQEWRIT